MATVVITGVGRGIGKALAEKFLSEGYRVIGTTLSGEASLEGVQTFQLDLSDAAGIARAAEAIGAAAGNIDILINNAGVLLDEEETCVDQALLAKTIEINLVGTVSFTEALKKHVVAVKGHIVNISSTAGSLTLADGSASHHPRHYPAYKISKAAINMYTRVLAIDLGDTATVSSVHPGWVKTEMGGEEAPLTPAEAAEGIYAVAIARPHTGQFWFKGDRVPW